MSRCVSGYRDLLGRFCPTVLETRLGVTVTRIGKGRADAFIREHHYSGTVVWNSKWHYGCFYRGTLVGVLQFGHPMNPGRGSKLHETVELNRMAFSDEAPQQMASGVMSAALRFLRADEPRAKKVQTFADERCGKRGAVYRACSFRFVGEHESEFYELDGEWFHKSMKGRPKYDKRGWWRGPKAEHFNRNLDRAVQHKFKQYRYERTL